MNAPLRIIERLKAELVELVAMSTEELVTGPARSFEEYKSRVGTINGLNTAISILDRVYEDAITPRKEET